MAGICDFGNELDCSGSGYRQVAVTCECGNESSGFITFEESVDLVTTCQFLRKVSVP